MTGIGLLARFEARHARRTMLVLGLLAGLGAGVAVAAGQVARRTSTARARLAAESGSPTRR